MAEKKSSKTTLTPLGDRVLLRPLSEKELEKKSSFGIIIPDTVSKERPERGVVVAVGEGRYNELGELVPMRVKTGDRVVFSKYGFDEIELEGAEYFILKEESILAVIK
ncbi:MAG: co-chaperone GroES [Candidatus Paceibacterota bacterium]